MAFVDDDPRGLQRTVGEFQANNEDITANLQVLCQAVAPLRTGIVNDLRSPRR
jgi:hypothetical protein